jgi:hypothetical protein
MNKNPTIELNDLQTIQLRNIWESRKNVLEDSDYRFVKLKLWRKNAVLSKNQLYRLTMTLAESGLDEMPEWLLELLDPPR